MSGHLSLEESCTPHITKQNSNAHLPRLNGARRQHSLAFCAASGLKSLWPPGTLAMSVLCLNLCGLGVAGRAGGSCGAFWLEGWCRQDQKGFSYVLSSSSQDLFWNHMTLEYERFFFTILALKILYLCPRNITKNI